MKNIFSVSIGLLCIVILTLFSGTFIDVNLQIQNAREYHSAVLQQIQSSNYNDYVISCCIDSAQELGYDIVIEESATYDDISDYFVSLSYPIRVLMFDQVIEGKIEGYAR
ncbi:hypothetical protein [Tannockella kyphosi]|uniref:hypothetical protein n=1 Tax=Tannockella kyphosi TaxID=2899121 RepID=UPI002013023D|nr:hypothetical protein [Tannockella kyphosi]